MTVLLIDHQRARFFDSVDTPGGLEERGHLAPEDPHGFLRHLEHRKEADYHGQRVPEQYIHRQSDLDPAGRYHDFERRELRRD